MARRAWTRADGSPDTEWARRVAAHRASRPAWWRTIETTDLAGELRRLTGAVLVDGMGTWLAAVLDRGAWASPAPDARSGRPGRRATAGRAGRVAARVDELVAAWRQTGARVVAVSDQVGSGVVPAYRGRAAVPRPARLAESAARGGVRGDHAGRGRARPGRCSNLTESLPITDSEPEPHESGLRNC